MPYNTVGAKEIEGPAENLNKDVAENFTYKYTDEEAEKQWELWKCLHIEGYVNPAENVNKIKKGKGESVRKENLKKERGFHQERCHGCG